MGGISEGGGCLGGVLGGSFRGSGDIFKRGFEGSAAVAWASLLSQAVCSQAFFWSGRPRREVVVVTVTFYFLGGFSQVK